MSSDRTLARREFGWMEEVPVPDSWSWGEDEGFIRVGAGLIIGSKEEGDQTGTNQRTSVCLSAVDQGIANFMGKLFQ